MEKTPRTPAAPEQEQWIKTLISPTGEVFVLFDENLADEAAALCAALGTGRIKRAGQIEATRDGQWQVDLRPCGGPLLPPCPTRKEAVIMKDAWLSEHLVEIAQHEKFWRGKGAPKKHHTPEDRKRTKLNQTRTSQQKIYVRDYRTRMQAAFNREKQRLSNEGKATARRLQRLKAQILADEKDPHDGEVKRQALDEFTQWADDLIAALNC